MDQIWGSILPPLILFIVIVVLLILDRFGRF